MQKSKEREYPIYGMLPNLLSGLLMGMTVDIYSLYYAPVGILDRKSVV